MSGRGRLRKWSLLVAALALVSTLAACGDDDDDDDAAGGGDEEAGSIWVLLPDTETSDRWEDDDRVYFTAAFEEAGLVEGEDFSVVNAENDAATQQSQAEQAIADGASVIVLTSLDPGSGATIIEQAQEEGIEVVEYDRFNTGGPGGDGLRQLRQRPGGRQDGRGHGAGDRRPQPAQRPGRHAQRRRGGQQLRSCSARATPRPSRRGPTPATGPSWPTSTSRAGTTPRPRRSWSRS